MLWSYKEEEILESLELDELQTAISPKIIEICTIFYGGWNRETLLLRLNFHRYSITKNSNATVVQKRENFEIFRIILKPLYLRR